jgi:hypothetical protein
LQENNIEFITEPEVREGHGNSRCAVQLQKETPVGLVDDICGNDVEEGFAGLCRSVTNKSTARQRAIKEKQMSSSESALC